MSNGGVGEMKEPLAIARGSLLSVSSLSVKRLNWSSGPDDKYYYTDQENCAKCNYNPDPYWSACVFDRRYY